MTVLRRLDRAVGKVEEYVLFALLLGLLGLAVFQVAWRNVIQPLTQAAPLLWADELLKHGTFALGLLGAALATRVDKHISIDVLSRLLAGRPRVRAALRLALGAGTIAACALLARAGLALVDMKEESFAQVVLHPWQWQVVIPAAFALVVFHVGVRLLLDVAAFVGGAKEEGAA